MTVVRADAVVIGAGAGGLCAAARLAHAGLHTIVVDDKDRVGGRASTEEIDGFKVNIGAIAIELGGVFEETFNTVGAQLDIRTPEPASSFFIDGKLIDVGRGGWSLLLGQLTKQASRILEKFADARSGNLPAGNRPKTGSSPTPATRQFMRFSATCARQSLHAMPTSCRPAHSSLISRAKGRSSASASVRKGRSASGTPWPQ
jgi:phytoene dehydrogenase-like protein